MSDSGAIHLACPRCKKPIRLRSELAGRRIRCPNMSCRHVFHAPSPEKPNGQFKQTPARRAWVLWGTLGSAMVAVLSVVAILLIRNSGEAERDDSAGVNKPPGTAKTEASGQGTKVTGTKTATIDSKNQPVTQDVPTMLKKGGRYWASPDWYKVGTQAVVGDLFIAGGEGLWIWPTEDRAYERNGEKQTITFRWQIRPGQKPHSGKFPPQGKLRWNIRNNRYQIRITALKLEGGPEKGHIRVNADFKDAVGESAVFWIETEPHGRSNLILLKELLSELVFLKS